ncbi:sulfatase-like hydrolase/transferase [Halostella salina]|uniref:sulfatase-like hydrolase/transferase n=1 Tax=Halostella salina TaxID=1547897 RepID=UPI001F0902AD|nr:sulfatase-like hydrolase/transferase [Halostella salina]
MTDSKRNLVLVSVDSLRADHCGFINPDSGLTPTIDRLADEGISYTQAIAPGPRTPSSVPVMFTGEFMSDDENWTMANWQGRQQRIGEHMTRFQHLSERLQRRGYETVAFTANPWTTRESNFDYGFDDFTEISADSPDIDSSKLSDSTLFTLADSGFEALPGDIFGWSSKKEWFSQWTGYFDIIQEKLADLSEPFFVWVFILDSHQPYITPRRHREESAAWEMYYSILRYWHGQSSDEELSDRAEELIGQAYRDAVRSVDGFVDALTEAVSGYDPVTVFHSDHGEALGEHGNFGHEQTLYEENLRVPLFVHNAGSAERVSEQVSLQSLPELFAALASGREFDPQAHTQPFVVSKTENNQVLSIRTPRWKFVTAEEDTQLYDLGSDPKESTDASTTHPEVASSLADLADRHRTTQTEKERVETAANELTAGGTPL